jgi:DNA-binding protein HU-beta
MIMNQVQLIDALALEMETTKKDAKVALNAILNVIEDALVAGEKISLSGFGNFEVKERAERNGVNPQTGEKLVIPACKAPVFKASKVLKESVNKG